MLDENVSSPTTASTNAGSDRRAAQQVKRSFHVADTRAEGQHLGQHPRLAQRPRRIEPHRRRSAGQRKGQEPPPVPVRRQPHHAGHSGSHERHLELRRQPRGHARPHHGPGTARHEQSDSRQTAAQGREIRPDLERPLPHGADRRHQRQCPPAGRRHRHQPPRNRERQHDAANKRRAHERPGPDERVVESHHAPRQRQQRVDERAVLRRQVRGQRRVPVDLPRPLERTARRTGCSCHRNPPPLGGGRRAPSHARRGRSAGPGPATRPRAVQVPRIAQPDR